MFRKCWRHVKWFHCSWQVYTCLHIMWLLLGWTQFFIATVLFKMNLSWRMYNE
jgi:hypothetical protein